MLFCFTWHCKNSCCMQTLCNCTYHSGNICILHLPTTGHRHSVSTKVHVCIHMYIYGYEYRLDMCFQRLSRSDGKLTMNALCVRSVGVFKSQRCTSLGCNQDNRRATCCSHTYWCHVTLASYAFSHHTHFYWSYQRERTCVSAGYEGKLALILMRVQALQGADHLATLRCVHTANLQTGQVVTHVPAIRGKSSVRDKCLKF